jgi:hypothetical protein
LRFFIRVNKIMKSKRIQKAYIIFLYLFFALVCAPKVASANSCSAQTTGSINFATSIDPSGSTTYYGTATGPTIRCSRSGTTLTFSSASCTTNCQMANLSPALVFSLGYKASGTWTTGNDFSVLYTSPSTSASSIVQSAYQNAAYAPSTAPYHNGAAITVTYNWSSSGGTSPYSGTVNVTIPINSVTATVSAVCNSGTNGTLAFATINPSGSTPASATGASLGYKCTKNTTFKVSQLSAPNGETTVTCPASGACSLVGIMKSTSTPTDTLGYTVSITSVGAPYVGTGFSAAVAIPFTGTVTVAQFQNALPHADYSEVVTVTITY